MKKYVIVRRADKFLVYLADEDGAPVGKPLSTHDTAEEAQAAVRSRRANSSHADGEGHDEKAKKSDEFHTPAEAAEMPAVEADAEIIDVLQAAEADAKDDERTIGRFPGKSTLKSEDDRAKQSGFKALGGGLWIATYSNNFKDKQGEILPASEHDRYIARVKAGIVPYPQLWHWHIPGTKHGEAKWIDRLGHMIVAIGTFDDTPEGKAAEQAYLAAKPGEITNSHGFYFDPSKRKDGVYGPFNTFEITTLWAGLEANEFTSFEAIKEKTMSSLTPIKKASLKRVFGERADALIPQLESIEAAGKALAEAGVAFKSEFSDVTPTDELPDSVDPADMAAIKELYTEVVKDSAVLANGLLSEQKARRSMESRLLRLEKAFEMEDVPAGKGQPVDEEKEAETAKAAKDELKEKQKADDPSNPYAGIFPGAYS